MLMVRCLVNQQHKLQVDQDNKITMKVKVEKGTKTCLNCFENKKLEEFNKHPHTRDGYTSVCTKCINKQNKTKHEKM